MRQIVLDTETTGLNARMGDRVIEIGCIELAGRSLTEKRFHHYLNPEREIDEGAVKVHGLTLEFLSDKPRFAEIAGDFIAFVQGSELIIHNAAFDTEFLDRELALAKKKPLRHYVAGVIDTLPMARELHPGKRNTLDALCERYGIDNTGRTLHGALKDASLLAEVYLSMTRGQESLIVEDSGPVPGSAGAVKVDSSGLVVLRATAEELEAHERILAEVDKDSKGKTVWRRYEAGEKV